AEKALDGRHAGRLVLVENTILVRVVLVKHVVDELFPGRQVRLAVNLYVQPNQQRPAVRQEDEVLHVAGRLWLLRRRGGDRDEQEYGRIQIDVLFHASTSLIGFEPGSVMRMGRPTLDGFCLVGSMPSAVATVARKSPTETLCSSTVVPSALVLP